MSLPPTDIPGAGSARMRYGTVGSAGMPSVWKLPQGGSEGPLVSTTSPVGPTMLTCAPHADARITVGMPYSNAGSGGPASGSSGSGGHITKE